VCCLIGLFMLPCVHTAVHTAAPRPARARMIESLVDDYVSTHALAVHSPAYGYVTAAYDCPLEIGNKIDGSLNAFLWAVVTNRSLVLTLLSPACEQFLERRDWLLPKDAPHKLPKARLNRSHAFNLSLLLRRDQPGQPHVLDGSEMALQAAAALATSCATPSDTGRAHARTLFALGAPAALGMAFNSMFRWKATVTTPVLELLLEHTLLLKPGWHKDAKAMTRAEPDALWLGVHVRHQQGYAETRIVNGSACVEGVVRAVEAEVTKRDASASRLPCVVLMASDRALALSLVRVRIEALGCAFVTTTNLSGRGPTVQHPGRKEHGEHVGVGAMRDLFMLSLVDVFFGTEGSTFSYLAGNILSSPSRGPILGAHNSPKLTFCSMGHLKFKCGRLHSHASRADDPPTLLVKPAFISKSQRLNDSAFCAAYGVLPATLGASA